MLRNYDSKSLWQADLDYCIHPWTDFSDWPRTGSTIMVRGEGAYVWNAEGEKFIDGIGGLWFANVGFGRQELIDAATRQLGRLPQSVARAHVVQTGDRSDRRDTPRRYRGDHGGARSRRLRLRSVSRTVAVHREDPQASRGSRSRHCRGNPDRDNDRLRGTFDIQLNRGVQPHHA